MRRPKRGQRSRRPAILFRPSKNRPSIPKPPTIDDISTPIEEPTKTEYDKPTYKAGKVIWRGQEYERKDIQQLIQALERTPVSGGRFPTEADFIINAWSNPTMFGVKEDDVYKQAQRWKNNYLKALDVLREGTVEDIQDIYDDLYWHIAEMDLDTYMEAMAAWGGDLSVAFNYDAANDIGFAERLSDIWLAY